MTSFYYILSSHFYEAFSPIYYLFLCLKTLFLSFIIFNSFFKIRNAKYGKNKKKHTKIQTGSLPGDADESSREAQCIFCWRHLFHICLVFDWADAITTSGLTAADSASFKKKANDPSRP